MATPDIHRDEVQNAGGSLHLTYLTICARPTTAPSTPPPPPISIPPTPDCPPPATSYRTHRVIAAKCRCGSPWCFDCGHRNAADRFRRLIQVVDTNWSVITLTLDPNASATPLAAWEAASDGRWVSRFIAKFNRRQCRVAMIDRFLARPDAQSNPRIATAVARLRDPAKIRYHRTLEFQDRRDDLPGTSYVPPTYMPHWHVLIDLPLVDQQLVQQFWNRGVVDASPIEIPARAIRYCVKPVRVVPEWARALGTRALKRFTPSNGLFDGITEPKVSNRMAPTFPGPEQPRRRRSAPPVVPGRSLGQVLDTCGSGTNVTEIVLDGVHEVGRTWTTIPVPWSVARPVFLNCVPFPSQNLRAPVVTRALTKAEVTDLARQVDAAGQDVRRRAQSSAANCSASAPGVESSPRPRAP